ncbi:MAG: CDGSH iron-sulfur domain-containing protein [Planctomycetota bacterium]
MSEPEANGREPRRHREVPGHPPGSRTDRPYVCWTRPGRYAVCTCGLSATQPFCDGAHRRDEEILERPLKVVVDESRWIAWCNCGRSTTPPECSGDCSECASKARTDPSECWDESPPR